MPFDLPSLNLLTFFNNHPNLEQALITIKTELEQFKPSITLHSKQLQLTLDELIQEIENLFKPEGYTLDTMRVQFDSKVSHLKANLLGFLTELKKVRGINTIKVLEDSLSKQFSLIETEDIVLSLDDLHHVDNGWLKEAKNKSGMINTYNADKGIELNKVYEFLYQKILIDGKPISEHAGFYDIGFNPINYKWRSVIDSFLVDQINQCNKVCSLDTLRSRALYLSAENKTIDLEDFIDRTLDTNYPFFALTDDQFYKDATRELSTLDEINGQYVPIHVLFNSSNPDKTLDTNALSPTEKNSLDEFLKAKWQITDEFYQHIKIQFSQMLSYFAKGPLDASNHILQGKFFTSQAQAMKIEGGDRVAYQAEVAVHAFCNLADDMLYEADFTVTAHLRLEDETFVPEKVTIRGKNKAFGLALYRGNQEDIEIQAKGLKLASFNTAVSFYKLNEKIVFENSEKFKNTLYAKLQLLEKTYQQYGKKEDYATYQKLNEAHLTTYYQFFPQNKYQSEKNIQMGYGSSKKIKQAIADVLQYPYQRWHISFNPVSWLNLFKPSYWQNLGKRLLDKLDIKEIIYLSEGSYSTQKGVQRVFNGFLLGEYDEYHLMYQLTLLTREAKKENKSQLLPLQKLLNALDSKIVKKVANRCYQDSSFYQQSWQQIQGYLSHYDESTFTQDSDSDSEEENNTPHLEAKNQSTSAHLDQWFSYYRKLYNQKNALLLPKLSKAKTQDIAAARIDLEIMTQDLDSLTKNVKKL